MRDNGMPVDDAPDDEDVRETYNFAPGSSGIVYRADTGPSGAGGHRRQRETNDGEQQAEDKADDHEILQNTENETDDISEDQVTQPKYKLQAMKWGLVPFWTKRDPGYSGLMKTINARDDKVAMNGGMWNSMKKTKRCIVVAQGFYEWLKKDGGKTKIPHFVKRKDGKLMCFAGLWDCVQYEGSDDRLWTYTIITTDSNKQLGFLHDRMPVILDNGSEDLRKWLDPGRAEWTRELQSLLKPYKGELECYPVNKDVGKVGNNSAEFIVPIDSTENKSNIANFFGNAKAKQAKISTKQPPEAEIKAESPESLMEVEGAERKTVKQEGQDTIDVPRSEDNAPMPAPQPAPGSKRKFQSEDHEKTGKQIKLEDTIAGKETSPKPSPVKPHVGRKTRSATSNGTVAREGKEKATAGSQKITNFFTK